MHDEDPCSSDVPLYINYMIKEKANYFFSGTLVPSNFLCTLTFLQTSFSILVAGSCFLIQTLFVLGSTGSDFFSSAYAASDSDSADSNSSMFFMILQ